jgi:hypothetical protein
MPDEPERVLPYLRPHERVEAERGTCCDCGGSGWVVVPHLDGVDRGEWCKLQAGGGRPSYYTVAVLCTCPLGGARAHGYDQDARPMRMVYYAVKNPHWREQMRERRERERAGGPAPDGEWAGLVGCVLGGAAGGAPANGDGHANGHVTNGDEWEPPEHV